MAPNLGGMRKGKDEVAPNAAMSPRDPALNDYVEALYELKKHVEENSDYVGDRFSDEARKIHYGEEEPCSIHGEATHARKPKSPWKKASISSEPWPKPDA